MGAYHAVLSARFTRLTHASGYDLTYSVACDLNSTFNIRATAASRAARRCIRVYCALLHGQHPETVDLSSLSAIELAVLREMVIEMYDSYPLMEVGNCVLLIDDEIHRSERVA